MTSNTSGSEAVAGTNGAAGEPGAAQGAAVDWWVVGAGAVGLAVSCLIFWPGIATFEIKHLLAAQESGKPNDWASVLLSRVYLASDAVFGTLGPVFVLQQLFLWLGLALLAQSAWRERGKSIPAMLAMALLPVVAVTNLMMWKDAWTVGLLCLGLGAAAALRDTGKRSWTILAVAASALLAATRHNALPLVLPNAVALASHFFPGAGARKQWAACCAAAVVGCGLVAKLMDAGDVQRCHNWHHALLWDLTALSIHEGEVLVPQEFLNVPAEQALPLLEEHFSWSTSDVMFLGANAPVKNYGNAFAGCTQDPPLDVLVPRFLGAVAAHPGAWLLHRLTYMRHLLGAQPEWDDRARLYYRLDSAVTWRFPQPAAAATVLRHPLFIWAMTGPAALGWPWLALFLLAGWLATRLPGVDRMYAMSIWLSGMAYLGTFAIIGSGAVLRYLVPFPVLAFALACTLTRRQRRPSPTP